jgi:hypothetical protein
VRAYCRVVAEPDLETYLRKELEAREKFRRLIWNSGPRGKAFVVFVLLALYAPLIFEVVAAFAVMLWVWPASGTVAEKLATLGFLFVVVNVLAWQVALWGGALWELALIWTKK